MTNILAFFLFLYPLFMSLFWIIGGLIFYYNRERSKLSPLLLEDQAPLVSILIPSFNEDENILETVQELMSLNYPNYEVIIINDYSNDSTESLLWFSCKKYEKLRVVNLKQNQGKANALSYGVLAARGEIVMTMDADAILDPDALQYIVPHFITPKNGERVGAVTGNPRIRNRSSLLAKIQFVEYSSIIGMIKRAQRVIGKVMTVSGVIVAFRKRALMDVGLWDKDLITDDIGITWKLQKRFWDVRYEPRAICWMLVPETIKGLWKQRIRWAQGGIEVIIRHVNIFKDYRQRRLYPIFLEQVLSILWAFLWLFYLLYILIFEFNRTLFLYGSFLALIAVLQLTIALYLDRKYEKISLKFVIWAAWYPLFYWIVNVLVLIPAVPRAFKILSKNKQDFATWDSPDRGLPR
ncbi:poly-beta-1,6-N-acetyl-D-glucosamine synthase [Alkalihalobacillus sp. BA299]|uniref:poly-beta-1,6-N-acetyl-D-glucosamine synthase n=1 Tax=Alkalihalobacillus sp. BA299 TaxID=2815938 RepID=UPI001ADADE97|nr:poly-beta-1,6-N-acetyl-D-glucosamine synthase [Alkalihalobacillus sp. BA299]